MKKSILSVLIAVVLLTTLSTSSFAGGKPFKGTIIYSLTYTGDIDPATTLDLKDSDYNSGYMLYMTAGARFIVPTMYLPTFSATMHNAFARDFAAASGYGGAPEQIKRTIDVGASMSPKVGKTTRLHIEVNYKDLTTQYDDVATIRRITFGMEFSFFRMMYLRFGYGDGFGSGGIGLKTKNLILDLTTYAIDNTTSAFRGAEDRRFTLTISAGL